MNWLDEFFAHQNDGGCSCSTDCDHERAAAYEEIMRLRSLLLEVHDDLERALKSVQPQA